MSNSSSISSAAPSLKPISRDSFGFHQARHLLNRAGFGGTPDQIRMLADLGPEKAVEHLVSFAQWPYEPVNTDSFDGDIMKPPTPEERLAYRKAQASQDEALVEKFRRMRQEMQRKDRQQLRQLQKWWLKRMIETPRPLEEKMTLFFHGHFATGYRTIEDSYHMFMQNQLFRTHSAGNFGDLCFAVIRDPAMLAYLDNNESHKAHPNENLAREFMELFTLGEGNAYHEDDIKEGARALTGYSFDHNDFVFREDFHDTGRKNILGKTGDFSGDDFVRVVLGRPECSQYITYKLYRYFVNDLPSGVTEDARRFIEALATRFRQEKYALAPVLETLFLSEHFYDAANVAAQIKSPAQLVVSSIRSLLTPVVDLGVLVEAMDLMGQNIFQPPSVKGWDGGRAWINTSTLFVRQNLLVHLLTGRMPTAGSTPGTRTDYDALKVLAHVEQVNGEYPLETSVDYLIRLCLGEDATTDRRDALLEFARDHGGRVNNELVIGILCLISAVPEFQLC